MFHYFNGGETAATTERFVRPTERILCPLLFVKSGLKGLEMVIVNDKPFWSLKRDGEKLEALLNAWPNIKNIKKVCRAAWINSISPLESNKKDPEERKVASPCTLCKRIANLFTICFSLLVKYKKEIFLWIVTRDKKWIYFDNTKYKKSWVDLGLLLIFTTKHNIHSHKVLLYIWWD